MLDIKCHSLIPPTHTHRETTKKTRTKMSGEEKLAGHLAGRNKMAPAGKFMQQLRKKEKKNGNLLNLQCWSPPIRRQFVDSGSFLFAALASSEVWG